MTGFPISGQQSDAALVIPQLDDHQSRPLMAKMARIFREIGAMSEVKTIPPASKPASGYQTFEQAGLAAVR